MEPKVGEIWQWHRDDSGCQEIYGPGIVMGIKEGYEYNSQEYFVTFHFANKGIMNIPIPMVKRFMYLIT
ncbi:MAG: hypothetical protein CMB77_03685 [Euryarchaeota archaeon]|nr:hypothetical protein [Euryarchaeota archaeon]